MIPKLQELWRKIKSEAIGLGSFKNCVVEAWLHVGYTRYMY